MLYQRGGELDKGKASVLACLLVLDKANVVRWKISIRCQGRHDGFHGSQRSNISQDDGWTWEKGTRNINLLFFFVPEYVGRCMHERQVLTVATEIPTGLAFRGSGIIAGFALCWENDREVGCEWTCPSELTVQAKKWKWGIVRKRKKRSAEKDSALNRREYWSLHNKHWVLWCVPLLYCHFHVHLTDRQPHNTNVVLQSQHCRPRLPGYLQSLAFWWFNYLPALAAPHLKHFSLLRKLYRPHCK